MAPQLELAMRNALGAYRLEEIRTSFDAMSIRGVSPKVRHSNEVRVWLSLGPMQGVMRFISGLVRAK